MRMSPLHPVSSPPPSLRQAGHTVCSGGGYATLSHGGQETDGKHAGRRGQQAPERESRSQTGRQGDRQVVRQRERGLRRNKVLLRAGSVAKLCVYKLYAYSAH